MSSEAIGWVWRHSPYSGATLTVHLAIGDSVNDQNRNEFWMSITNLAVKARMERATASRAVSRILEDGGIVCLVDHRNDKAGRPSKYRFVFPDWPVEYETRGGVSREHTPDSPCPEDTPPVSREHTNPREPKHTSSLADVAPTPTAASGDERTKPSGQTIREAFAMIVAQRIDNLTFTPDNPPAYRTTVKQDVQAELSAEANDLMRDNPRWDAAELAEALEPAPDQRPAPPSQPAPYRHVPDADETARRWAEDDAERADEGVPDLEEVRRITAEAKANLKRRTSEDQPVNVGVPDTGPSE